MMARLVIAVCAFVLLIAFALRSAGTDNASAQLAVSTEGAGTDERRTTPPAGARDGARQGNDRAQDSATTVTMTLLHNNDGESKLLPDPEGGFPGIARFAETWVNLGRASDADILLRVSAGDAILASPELSVGLARPDQPLYDSIALRGLYEVLALGNHDFDFGPEVTARFVEGLRSGPAAAATPFVAANLDVSGEPALAELAENGLLAPSHVVTDPTSGQSVGVIGAITPRLANISSPGRVIVDADIAAAVNAEVARLGQEGVDRIVLVSHLQGLAEDRELVPLLSGVDIVVAGGGQELLRNEGDSCQPDVAAGAGYPLILVDADGVDVPLVTTPGGYRCIGRLEVSFDTSGTIVELEGESIEVPLDGKPEAYALTRVERPLAKALAEFEATVVGLTDVALDGRRASVRTASSNLGELLADALLSAAIAEAPAGLVPVIAVQNGGGIRNDSVIPPGELTLADMFDVAPFANFVAVGEVPRERFKELLEVAVAGLPAAEGRFAQISGFTIEVDASAPGREVATEADCALVGDPGSRVRNVTLADGTEIVKNGQVLAGADLVVATIDFLAAGGDCYPLADLAFTKGSTSYQAALSNFIAGPLDGRVSADEYPEGGSRIRLGDDAAEAASPPQDLADTGLQSWLGVVIATAVVAAGAMVYVEARLAARRSLTTRLAATRPWIPDADPEVPQRN